MPWRRWRVVCCIGRLLRLMDKRTRRFSFADDPLFPLPAVDYLHGFDLRLDQTDLAQWRMVHSPGHRSRHLVIYEAVEIRHVHSRTTVAAAGRAIGHQRCARRVRVRPWQRRRTPKPRKLASPKWSTWRRRHIRVREVLMCVNAGRPELRV